MRLWLLAACLCLMATACDKVPQATIVTHGRFKEVKVYHDADNDTPPVVLIYSEKSETRFTSRLIQQLLARNTDVFTISTERLEQDFPRDIKNCYNLSGDFENLSRYIEAYFQYPGFIPPVFAATPSSETLADTVLTPVAPEAFLGKVSFTGTKGTYAPKHGEPPPPPIPEFNCTIGPDDPAHPAPVFFVSETGNTADKEQLELALTTLQQRVPAGQALDSTVGDLPLTELPGDAKNNSMAILISGDGGWAGFDKKMANSLQKRGVSVVGWDSLRYFWKPSTPESLAADLDKVIEYYKQHWSKKRIFLMGFSQGANVLPFTVPLLSKEAKAAVAKVALISPEQYAQFEFHMGNWVHSTDSGLQLLPKLKEKQDIQYLCLYGSADKASVCPGLESTPIRIQGFPGGHHPYNYTDDIAAMLVE